MQTMPELSGLSLALIVFFVVAVLWILWELWTAPTMSEEDEKWDRFYEDMYKSRKKKW